MPSKPSSKNAPGMPTFPMRINKYLAHKNYSTRRGADALIEQEKVLINGKVAKLGDKVTEKDVVEVRTSPGEKSAERIYLAYHKPAGIVTNSPREGEESIADILTYTKHKLFPIGRLDMDTRGLMILTNDGRITDRMLNPTHQHEKEYEVRVDKHFSPSLLNAIEQAEELKGGTTTATAISDTEFSVTLTSSNPQLKTIAGRLHYEVMDLVRTRIVNIKLGSLKENGHREIKGAELSEFLSSLGL